MPVSISPQFGSKLYLVSRDKNQRLYEKALKRHNLLKSSDTYSGHPWNETDIVVNQPVAFTDNALNCNIFAVHNGENVVLGHLDPEENIGSHEFSYNGIKSKIETLLNDGKKFKKGLILSGRQLSGDTGLFINDNKKKSYRLFLMLNSIFEELKIPHSIIWGDMGHGIGKFSSMDLLVDPQKDTFYISGEYKDKSQGMQNYAMITSLATLKGSHEIVYIHPDDELKLGASLILNA